MPLFSSLLLSSQTASLLSVPLPTIILCPEGKGPVVSDHFKLLVPNGSHTRDTGHGDKAFRVDILGKREELNCGNPQRPSPSLTPSASVEMKAAAVSHR